MVLIMPTYDIQNKKTGEVRKYRMNRVIDKNANEYMCNGAKANAKIAPAINAIQENNILGYP